MALASLTEDRDSSVPGLDFLGASDLYIIPLPTLPTLSIHEILVS